MNNYLWKLWQSWYRKINKILFSVKLIFSLRSTNLNFCMYIHILCTAQERKNTNLDSLRMVKFQDLRNGSPDILLGWMFPGYCLLWPTLISFSHGTPAYFPLFTFRYSKFFPATIGVCKAFMDFANEIISCHNFYFITII